MSTRQDLHYHEDHLRRLLDQRAARADLHGRFPSVSEFSDSPSVYSHAHFSPRPVDRDLEPSTSSYHHFGVHDRRPSIPQSPGITDRQRLNIPDASSLDLDDDTQPSYTPEPSTGHDDADDDIVADETGDDDTEVHRISAYGPKMTVHSRAPWEMGEDDIVDLDDTDGMSKKPGFKFARKDNPKKSRQRDGRHQCETRPSLESLRSQTRSKQSFETTSSQVSAGGALLALAHASMSSTSLTLAPSPQTSLRDKLAIPRFRSRTPSNNNLQQRPDPVDTRPYHPNYSQANVSRLQASSPTEPEYYRTESRASFSDPPSPHTPLHQQEYHPYANPHLTRSYAREPSPSQRLEELHALAHSEPHSPAIPRSESTATVTESSTVTTISTVSQSRSNGTVMTPDTSTFSINKLQAEFSPTARSFAKGISAPIPLDTPQRLSNESGGPGATPRDQGYQIPSMSGWQDSPHNNIKLISLEEAQAQARERSRSATVNGASNNVVTTSPGSARTSESSSTQSSAWTRMRSQSGSNQKIKNFASASVTDLHSMHSVSDGKTVLRKKSGFMRLFNGKEKMPSSPPPVPSISVDALGSPTPSVAPSRSRKQSQHRVPVPSITPSILAESESGSSGRPSDEDVPPVPPLSPQLAPVRDRQLSARRKLPGLSIVTNHTQSSVQSIKSPIETRTPLTAATAQTFASEMSSSNPSFVAPLSIRPVSTMFGSDFSGISSPEPEYPRPALDSDCSTPTTASVISPRSPPPPGYKLERRSSDGKVAQVGEDQSSIIQTLQEQIITARRVWQQQIWELEGQVRDLKAEVDELRSAEKNTEYCATCRRGTVGKPSQEDLDHVEDLKKAGVKVGGVVNRPRARTGIGSRFGSAIS
ncbi:hypothetical protein BDY19DRAFT_902026 [Irpex rosettiformis]|uniref:Uncharacterized protein n=1 Tax=Irpex rosettiformis TaxID=378272 RepID=A0ACB8UKV3_9APHY|nr:hypothetical protein BDY19DRAFT_902026 [Irpex rosettiformis]